MAASCLVAIAFGALGIAQRRVGYSLLRPSRSQLSRRLTMAEANGEERDWDGAFANLTAVANATAASVRPPSPEDEEPVYNIASSRERLGESRKKYVDTMNEREEQLVNIGGNEQVLLGALAVVGLILCFYIYVGVSGGLDTPRPDILIESDVPGAFDAGERLLESTR